MMIDSLTKKEPKQTDIIAFCSGKDYENTRNALIQKINVGGEI